MAIEVILPVDGAARFASLYSLRKAGYVRRVARVLGVLGSSVEVVEPERGLSVRDTSDDTLLSGDVVRHTLGPAGTRTGASHRGGPLRSPVWRSKCASAPRGGLSSSPWMPPRLKPEHTRSPRHGWAGTTRV
jgi:hypothetical protein